MTRHQKTVAATIVGLICTSLVSLAASGLVWSAYEGKKQEQRLTAAALTESEGGRLLASASLQVERNPGLGLALAVRGAEQAPGPEANNTLLSLLDANHEYATLRLGPQRTGLPHISRDGQFVVLTSHLSSSGTDPVPAQIIRVADGRVLRELGTGERTTSAVFSPDGRFVLTTARAAGSDRGSRSAVRPPVVWETATANQVAVFPEAQLERATEGAFDPVSRRVVLPQGHDAVASEIRSGRADVAYRGHTDRVTSAEFSPDGTYVLTVSEDATIRIWDADDASPVGPPIPWTGPDSGSVRAGFAADSRHVCVRDIHETRLYAIDAAAETAIPIAVRTPQQMQLSRTADVALLYNEYSPLPQITVVSTKDFGTISQFPVPRTLDEVRTAIAPDGRAVAIAAGADVWIHDAETGNHIATLRGHQSDIRNLAFGDGRRVATVSNQGTLRLWHSRSGAERRTLALRESGETDRVVQLSAAVDPTGRQVAVPSRPRSVTKLRDNAGQVIAGEFLGIPSAPVDATQLVTSLGSTVRVHDVASSREVFRGEFAADIATAVFADAARRHLLVISHHGHALLVDTDTGSRHRLLSAGEEVIAYAVRPDQDLLILTTSAARLLVASAATGQELWMRRHLQPLDSVSVSGNAEQIATVDNRGAVLLWDRNDASLLPRVRIEEADATGVVFCQDDNRILYWNSRGGEAVTCAEAADGAIVSRHSVTGRVQVAWSPQAALAAIASTTDGLVTWDPNTETVVKYTDAPTRRARFLNGHIGAVCSSPDDDASRGRTFRVWRIGDPAPISEESFHSSALQLEADAEHDRFVLRDLAWVAEVFEFTSGRHLLTGTGHPEPLEFLGFAGQPPRLLTVSRDGTIGVSGAARQENVVRQAPGAEITAVAVSNDGQLFVTGSSDGVLTLWSGNDASDVRTLPSGGAEILSARFDASGNRLVTTEAGGTVRLVDLRSDAVTEFAVPAAHFAEFSPDGRRLLVLGGESAPRRRTVRIVDTTTGDTTDVTQAEGTRWAAFDAAGSRYGLLSSEGRLDIRSLADGERDHRLELSGGTAVRFAFAAEGDVVAVDQGERLSCWNLREGTLMFHVPQLPGFRYRKEPDIGWQPFAEGSRWLLVTDFGVRRIPVDLLAFARQHPPRELTDDERQQFGLASEAPDLAGLP